MKDFILKLFAYKTLGHKFWRGPSSRVVVRPLVPKSLIIDRHGNEVTITETHVSLLGWCTHPAHDDIEMRFRIDEFGTWTPLYLKRGTGRARLAYNDDHGAISWKPTVTKRQQSFALIWAQELVARRMLDGIVEE